jgi:hypothetical protein
MSAISVIRKFKHLLVCLLVTLPLPLVAEVLRFDILARAPLGAAAGYGAHGPYEEITGTLHFAVDPADPHNALIADIELAPRNAAGLVEFSADVVIWTPVDTARGSGVTLVDIPNRGTRRANLFNMPAVDNPAGDGFLLREGFAVVWIGWEYDVPNAAAIGIEVPSVPGIAQSAVAGLGFAAIRDTGSWLKHGADVPVRTEHLISFGLSQSGRVLRTYLYLGFNEDEAGRQVYDGMLPHIAGASRIDLNRRGAAPIGLGQYDATAFPFTDAAYTDPVSGVVDGLLDNARARATQPRIFYTNSGVEYWSGGRVATLTHALPDGSADIPLQDNVRQYYLASTQHGPGAFPPAAAGNGQLRDNPLDYWWNLRALLLALRDWVVADVAPPASKHPRLDDATLVGPADVAFPALPGVPSLAHLTAGFRVANPLLAQSGEGAPLPLLVPQVDADGNDIAGIRHPELAVPLATYTGWNFTNPARGAPDTLATLTGSYLPFAATEAQRQASGDPRASLAARYEDRSTYLQQVEAAGNQLVDQRYLLPADVAPIVERAGRHWDLLTGE